MFLETIHSQKISLPVTPKNIHQTQRFAKIILAKREKERQRDAQNIQKSLDEVENRLAEVRRTGIDLEHRFQYDKENEWLLENWLLYSEEYQRLRIRKNELNKRVKLINFAEEYIRLRKELQVIQSRNFTKNDLTTDDLNKLDDIECSFEVVL